jgi:hypothetical protein
MGLIRRLFSTQEFMPHGMCYAWNSNVIWLHVLSDGFIALAYYSIPITLVYFVRKRKDLSFNWIFICFALFIVACGTTHVMEIISIWHPLYWLSGLIKAVTAATSIITAILLVRLAAYTVSCDLARSLGLKDVLRLLAATLSEEEATDAKLARSSVPALSAAAGVEE